MGWREKKPRRQVRERAEGEAEGSQGARAEVGRVSRTKGGNEGGAGDGGGETGRRERRVDGRKERSELRI